MFIMFAVNTGIESQERLASILGKMFEDKVTIAKKQAKKEERKFVNGGINYPSRLMCVENTVGWVFFRRRKVRC